MLRSSKNLVLLACVAFACGSPSELDEDAFPPLDQTGYTDGNGGSGAAPIGAQGGTNSVSGAGGTNSVSGAGGTNNVSGAGGVPSGGTGGTPGVAGTGGGAPAGQCPDDILVLLNRPNTSGGCAGGACHVPGGIMPDLTSPGIESRILNVTSTNCNPRPYVAAGESLIADKLTGMQGSCGFPMPYGAPAGSLNDADRACILAWLDELGGGG